MRAFEKIPDLCRRIDEMIAPAHVVGLWSRGLIDRAGHGWLEFIVELRDAVNAAIAG
jgi:hypothetical protein